MERILGSPPEEPVDLADLAVAAGYADQSHMGRNVRTLTGLSPGQLRLRIADDEAFWYYRLVGSAVPKRLQ